MKILSLPPEMASVIDSNNGLKVYLKNLQRGRAATPRAWLYEDRDSMEVVHEWIKKYLEPLKQVKPYGETVYQFDISKLEKCVPQGEVAPIKELMDTVTAGFRQGECPQPAIYRSQAWKQAKALAVKYLIKDTGLYKKLRPRAYKHVVDDMRSRDTLESNSGYPDFSRRKNPEVLSSAYADIKSGKYLDYPAIILFRNYKGKTRMVWMYPMSVNIVEGSFTQPLKDALMKSDLNFIAPWRGYDHVLNRITKHYNEGEFIAASDFSHTDEFFTIHDTLEVYDVIKYAFQEEYWEDLKISMTHINKIPLLISENEMITGLHGVSSGSNWTNDVETYYDFIFEIFNTLTGIVDEPDMAIGDDISHRKFKFDPDLDAKLAKVYKMANKDVNAEKVTNKRDHVKFLQRLTIRGYKSDRTFVDNKGNPHQLLRGIYPSVWALWSSLQPEKFHSIKLLRRLGIKAKELNASRLFMIAENLIDHPLFVDYVKFICRGNPYLVEFAKKTDQELNKITRLSHLVPGFNPTYNQEKRDEGLASFASIRIAKEL